ncbi:hypothetical protein OEZ85_002600 [Tetradesmus obliquus]|uniref:Anaphase-promoting complex subunit 1 n=1 Tax=Tetradesmus obliquus TaxID=3088 RepID=A0ABY8TYK4_TETOB|nr:hypothetical protein OEZ85_002600 [Tetradesmus obliquus]
MLGKQLQLVEGEQQWEAYGLALIRQEAELQEVPFCPEKCTVLYAAGSSGCTGVASEQCVVIYENKAVWTSGRSVRKRFTVESDILQACWKSSITCIYPSGEQIETPLLQPCTALWPLTAGVLLVGPADSSASVLSHPLEEPSPVVADCALSSSSSSGRSNVAAYAGWSQESVVWTSRELPFVATYNEARGRLSIWHMRPLPPEAAGIGSSFDLPVVSPLGLLQHRTPAAAAAASAYGSPFGGSAGGFGSAGRFAGSTAGFSSAGGSGGLGATGAAAYSSSLLGPIVAGGTPRTAGGGGGKYGAMSVGAGSTARRSALRTPQGCLPASIFSPTPQQSSQAPWAGGLGALGVLRPCFSNTTQAQQALLLPGPDPPVLFKLACCQQLTGGGTPAEACLATDADGVPLLCVLCRGGSSPRLVAFRLAEADSSSSRISGSSHVVVKPAFSIAALAAVPVATGFSLPSSSSSSSSRELLDLLVLHPSGQLLLHRGCTPLISVGLTLPSSCLQRLASAAAAAAGKQGQGLRGSAAAAAAAAAGVRPGTAGSLGCWSLSDGSPGGDESDDMLLSPGSVVKGGSSSLQAEQTPGKQQQQQQQQCVSITGLSCAAGDRWLGSDCMPCAAVSVRVMPCVLALHVVLRQMRHLQLLAACLLQPGACCGHLGSEWRAIASVLIAWAIKPGTLDQVHSSQLQQQQQQQQQQQLGQTTPLAAAAGQFGSPVTARAAQTPAAAAAAAAAGDEGLSEDMDMQGWDVLALDGLPLGVALPLKEAAARCRTNPPAGWPIMASGAFGAGIGQSSNAGVTGELGLPIDGMEGVAGGISSLRFGRDERLAEVQSLLGTNMPVVLTVPGPDSDPDLPAKQQAALLSSALRTMALPLGRGAFTLGLSQPLPGEQLGVPLLCLSGVVPGPGPEGGAGGRVLVNLDLTNAQPAPGGGAAADVTAWCEFHNGVAAGIKIAPRRRHRLKQQQQQQQQQQAGVAAPQHGSQTPNPNSTEGATPSLAGSVAGAAAEGAVRPEPGSSSSSSSSSSSADSLADAWLPHSKPVVPNYAHAGVLLALGLTGHLDRLSWTDLYRYLSDQHEPTTIGVLLGMAACSRGAADTTVARMLLLHLPARHPSCFPEIELSPHVQAASLLGLGLLYQGSCHRLMSEIMLEEITRTPGVNPSLTGGGGGLGAEAGGGSGLGASLSSLMCVMQDREGYALAAGFGLGLICLGQGRSAPGLADLHLEDKLRALMDGSSQPHSLSRRPQQPPKAKAAAAAAGPNSAAAAAAGLYGSSRPGSVLDAVLGTGVVGWDAAAGGLREDPSGLGSGAAAAAGGGGGGVKLDADLMQQYGISQVVLEGQGGNTAVTGPAAAMALMMMYLKTGDADVAARFKVPDSVYALDHMRPSLVLLMVLGKALVLWEGISATQEWISAQLPPLLDQPLLKILDAMLAPPAAAAAATPGSTPAAAAAARSGSGSLRGPAGHAASAVDWGAVGLAYVHALAGACFAIGLRFAGTCNAGAEALLRHHLLQLLHAKRRAPGGPNEQSVAPAAAAAAAAAAANGAGVGIAVAPAAGSVGQLDKGVIENCISVVLLALALVMAGSGHLPTFRLIQVLSRRSAGPLRATGAEGQTPGGIAALLSGPGVGCGQVSYGHHLATSLAAGLLFLSAGRASISSSNEAVAALLIALYPVWPNSPTDQRCHLQAFRHLYVLAAEPRCLQAVDVHSRQQVVVPLQITAHKHGMVGPQPAAAAAAAQAKAAHASQQHGVQGLMAAQQQQQQQQQQQGGSKGPGKEAAAALQQLQQQQQRGSGAAAGVGPAALSDVAAAMPVLAARLGPGLSDVAAAMPVLAARLGPGLSGSALAAVAAAVARQHGGT